MSRSSPFPVPSARAATRWVPVVAVAGALLVASLVPGAAGPPSPAWPVGPDKVGHAVGYAVLGAALAAALGVERPRRVALAVGLAVAFGAGVEWLQVPVPGRHGDLADAAANAVGALAGAGGYRLRRRGRR